MAPLIFDGAGTIAGLQAGGLPDSSVTSADIANGAITAAKIGYAGAILQVVQTAKTDTFTTSSQSFVDITGLSASITPASSSNKILIIMTVNWASSGHSDLRLVRGSTAIAVGDASGSRTPSTTHIYQVDSNHNYTQWRGAITWLDSPSTTSSTTYKIQAANPLSASYTTAINRSIEDGDSSYAGRTVSTITLMEVAA